MKDNVIEKIEIKKNNFKILCRFHYFLNNELVKIIIDINYQNILTKDSLYISDSDLLNIKE